MSRWPARQGRRHGWILSGAELRAVALATVVALACGVCVPVAAAAPTPPGRGVPPVKMYGYAAGPGQRVGSAARKAHYVPASATQAHPAAGSIKGHPAPAPDLAPPVMGTRPRVTVSAVRMAPGHVVAGH